ncbi:holo-ACP synthase [Candidatus Curtissbacteria bacterium]|nr:holo-ACP synthase [Candidatus Curtissbacteria bacterium]
MQIKSGIDLVFLPKFRKTLSRGGSSFLKRVYLESELEDKREEHLAGIFAAKEAVMKALGLPKGSWQDIEITYRQNGAPIVRIMNYEVRIKDSLSISHDGDYVVAYFVALISNEL